MEVATNYVYYSPAFGANFTDVKILVKVRGESNS